MLEEAKQATRGALDELQLRDELRALRTKIPDTPALNPIVSVAFDLSRRLEAGKIGFSDLRALATRMMDRACVHRARHLRERIGFVDRATTAKEFAALRRGDGQGRRLFRLQGPLGARAHRHRLDRAPDIRAVRGAVASHGRDRRRGRAREPEDRHAAPSRQPHNARLRARQRASRDRKSARRLRRSSQRLLRGRRLCLRRQGAEGETAPCYLRLLGRLRSRRAQRHPLDLLVSRAHQGEAGRPQRYPRSLPRAQGRRSATAPRCSACRGRSPASSTWRLPRSTSRSRRSTRWGPAASRSPRPPTSSRARRATTSSPPSR